jgi:hypothetical protein
MIIFRIFASMVLLSGLGALVAAFGFDSERWAGRLGGVAVVTLIVGMVISLWVGP